MRGAIFDMDGLLLDTERLFQLAWRELAQEHGFSLDDAFTPEICGCGRLQSHKVLARYFPGMEPEPLIAACKAKVDRMEEQELRLKPGVAETVPAMKDAGFRMAIASSSPQDMVRRNLERVGILHCFDALVSGEEVSRGKPFPDIFLLAAERIHVPPKECYVFEDSLTGIRAAHAAGSTPVMIPDQFPPTEEIRAICRVYPDLAAFWRDAKP